MKSSSKLGAHITPHKERMMYTPPDRRKHVIKQVPAGKKGYTKKQSLDYQSRYRYKTNTNWVVQIDKLVCNMICIKNFAGYVRAAKSKRPIKLVPRPIMEGIFKDYTNGSEYNGELVLESTKVVDEECETVNYKTMTSGAHGIAPVKVLLYLCRNLFVLKGPGQKETFYKLPWHNIQIPEDKEAKKGIFGAYAMLHWKNGEFSVGMDNDFKESGKQWLDNDTLDALEEFGLDVARTVFSTSSRTAITKLYARNSRFFLGSLRHSSHTINIFTLMKKRTNLLYFFTCPYMRVVCTYVYMTVKMVKKEAKSKKYMSRSGLSLSFPPMCTTQGYTATLVIQGYILLLGLQILDGTGMT